MARKKPHEEHENHERWLVSYADFITLLFAFFVVMYAISSVNEGKFRVLSSSMIAAFKDTGQSLSPIDLGQVARSGSSSLQFANIRSPIPEKSTEAMNTKKEAGKGHLKALKRVADEVEKALSPLIRMGVIDVRRNDLWVEIEIKSNILFQSGSSELIESASPVLNSLAEIVKDTPFAVRIEGHTDDVPIYTDLFRSNWELSAGRAASVVRLFQHDGVDPKRLALVGYGEFKPKVPNDSEENRAANRRVVMLVLSDEEARRELEAQRAAELQQEVEKGYAELRGEGGEVVDAPIVPPVDVLPPPPIPILSLDRDIPRGPGGEPIDVTGKASTDVGVFPIISPPIKVPPHSGRTVEGGATRGGVH